MFGVTVSGAVAFAPAGKSKFARTLAARRGLLPRIANRAQQVRNSSQPLVWFHAPSVGEGLQARPVIEALRSAHPTIQIAYTFFSPSAEAFARSVDAEIVDYLPFDTAANAHAIIEALQPAAIVFSKLDVWPVLVEVAGARGIPCLLVSATVAPRSARLGLISRAFVTDAYASLHAVGAIDAANATRLEQLGARREIIRITGDTRFDQVAQRASSVDVDAPPLYALRSTRLTLVAGSTWPADEAALLPAWTDVLGATKSRPRLIIAPHEPTEAHLQPIEQWARLAGLNVQRLEAANGETDVVLVNRTGVLGQLYALADAAFVGGGFHAAGLHSVIEPAAFRIPVAFGPGHDMSREAGLLLAAGGGKEVQDRTSLATVITRWLTDDSSRKDAGAAAGAVVGKERGAVAETLKLIENVL